MNLPIITHPNPILRKKAKEIKNPASQEMRELATNLTKTMTDNQGVGLAAPQVGISLRLITVAQAEEPLILFNPRIVKKSFKKFIGEEGCLSIADVFGPVKRHRKITVCGLNKLGQKIKINAEGMLSRVLQHEIDHLDGILFIDKLIKPSKDLPGEE